MKPVLYFFACIATGLIACSDGPTELPKQDQPEFSLAQVNENRPESTVTCASSNQPVMWRVFYGSVTDHDFVTPEVGPMTNFCQVLTDLQALTLYRGRIEARLETLRVPLTFEFLTQDYEPCDSRNTTAKKVAVTVTYTSPNPTPYVLLSDVEVLDCAGNLLTDIGTQMGSQNNGQTYTKTWLLPVNYPGGSGSHSFRAMRAMDGRFYDGWAEGAYLRFNGVMPTQHSEPLPPHWACDPSAGCLPGVRWYFQIDSSAVVHP